MGSNKAYYAEYDEDLACYIIFRKDGTKLGVKAQSLNEVGVIFEILGTVEHNVKLRKSDVTNDRRFERQGDRIYSTGLSWSSKNHNSIRGR